MLAIHRKLIRDVAHMKGQMMAIILVIACGIATFVMSLCMTSEIFPVSFLLSQREALPLV